MTNKTTAKDDYIKVLERILHLLAQKYNLKSVLLDYKESGWREKLKRNINGFSKKNIEDEICLSFLEIVYLIKSFQGTSKYFKKKYEQCRIIDYKTKESKKQLVGKKTYSLYELIRDFMREAIK